MCTKVFFEENFVRS